MKLIGSYVSGFDRNSVFVCINKLLDESSVPLDEDFTVSDKLVTGVEVLGSTVVLTTDTDFEFGASSTISYVPSLSPIQSVDLVPLPSFLLEGVTNTVPEAVFELLSATIFDSEPSKIYIAFSQPVTNTPVVTANDGNVDFTHVLGSTVVLWMSKFYEPGDVVTISGTFQSTGFSNVVLSNQSVTNEVV